LMTVISVISSSGMMTVSSVIFIFCGIGDCDFLYSSVRDVHKVSEDHYYEVHDVRVSKIILKIFLS
jgi:hypothetical protein